jgi:Caspase domain
MCVYAEDVRQGRWPDRVAPEFAVQSVYLAILHEQLIGVNSHVSFNRDVAILFDAVAAHLEAGGTLLDEPFLQRIPALQRYVAALREDRKLFAEDLRQSRMLEVSLPPQASTNGTWRAVQCLVLDRPVATQFKLWARIEVKAALLLVRQPDGLVVLSADPAMKLKLGWLAPFLTKREGAEWYDGARHEGTLIASPKTGTQLTLDEIINELSQHSRVMKRRPIGPLAALGGALGVILIGLFVGRPSSTPSGMGGVSSGPVISTGPVIINGPVIANGPVISNGPTTPAPTSGGELLASAKGAPLPPAQVSTLLAAKDGPRAFQRYAIVAGVCGYTGAHALRSPCRDARSVRDLLIRRLGYSPDHVLFFVDRPEPGEPTEGVPTAANLKLSVERFRERTHASERSSLLFYYSGHGGYEQGARQDFGVLQPAGYFDNETQPISVRGWDMQELIDDLRKGVPSKHVMVVLDACYSGWAVGAKGDEALSPELRTLWAERAEVVLTAGTKGQRAWEDEVEPSAWKWGGHSALTAFFLEALGASGPALADRNGDQVVTDEELALYLREGVPPAVRAARHAEQQPQFFRFDEQLPKSGQFFFVAGEPR